MNQTIPVTVLSGTLGAGKTTVLNHVLGGNHDAEIAVLVNDVGEVNVDAAVVERRTDEEVVELSNGCICCGLQGELEHAVFELALEHDFEHLLIEPSGISEPAPVAKQFVEGRPSEMYDLQSVTTVVDARQFYDAFENGQPRRHGADDEDPRPLSGLIVEGVEFCDTLILNKTDLVDDEELETVRADIRTLQPDARILPTEYGQVDPTDFLEGRRFDRDAVERGARWRKVIDAAEHEADHADHGAHDHEDHDHTHPPEEYGIDSVVYHRPEPMHPERLADFLRETPERLIRAKGWLHVAGRPDHAMELSLAGSETQVSVAGRWIASLPEDQRKQYRKQHDPNWTDEYGDRETQLVLIGRTMDTARIERRLDECLLGSTELDGSVENPFPEREGETLRMPTEDRTREERSGTSEP
ncbi:MAG: GTP-binding protein [Natronomonas sp.]